MKRLLILALLPLALSSPAQQRLTLDLQQTIALANDSSLEAFRAKNMYLSGYWEWRTYKANRLPSLTLDLTPAQYYRDITRRYDSEADIDVYRSQQSFYAYGNLSLQQNFDLTGGTFYANTSLGYMRNFGANKYTQYTSVPFQVGYTQDLVGYNAFRWERKIEPLKYEKVKKEYIYNAEQVSEQATTYFFQLAMAQAEYDLAKDNALSTDTLYRIGEERLKIAAISRADLLTLKLDRVNAGNTLQTAASALKRAKFSLASFLNLPKDTDIRLVLPGRPQMLTIPLDQALAMARENNPQFLSLRQDILEAEQEVDRTRKESRFNASINASIGFNQVAEDIGSAYRKPLQQDMVSVSVSIPLVDWGVRKGKYNTERDKHRGGGHHDRERLQHPAEPGAECLRGPGPRHPGLRGDAPALHHRQGGHQQPHPLAQPPAGGAAQLHLRPAGLLAELLQDTEADALRLRLRLLPVRQV